MPGIPLRYSRTTSRARLSSSTIATLGGRVSAVIGSPGETELGAEQPGLGVCLELRGGAKRHGEPPPYVVQSDAAYGRDGGVGIARVLDRDAEGAVATRDG